MTAHNKLWVGKDEYKQKFSKTYRFGYTYDCGGYVFWLESSTKNKYKIREQALCLIKLLKHTVGIIMAV